MQGTSSDSPGFHTGSTGSDSDSAQLAEFDRVLPLHGEAGEFIKQKAFVPRTARRTRAFQAFLTSADLSTLLSAQRQLHARLRGMPDKLALGQPQMDLLNALPPDSTDSADIRTLYLPMLARGIKAHRRRLVKQRPDVDPLAPQKVVEKPRQPTGIATPKPISQALRRFLSECCDLEVPPEGVPRTVVVKAVPAYIKKHGLNEGKIIKPDTELALILGERDTDDPPLTFFNMQKCFGQHFLKPTDSESDPDTQ